MHATWQALQPMHLDSSMSLATSSVFRMLGEGVVVAERDWMSSDDCMVMALSSGFLDVHEERLELRRLRVRVADVRRQRVREVAVLRHPHESPVDRDAHGMHLLAVALERTDALGDHARRLDLAPVGAHLDHLAVRDALLLRQILADLDELLRLDDGVELHVLRPEVLML